MSEEAPTIAITVEIDDPALADRLALLLGGVAGLRLVAPGQTTDVAIVSRGPQPASEVSDSAYELTPRERDVLEASADGRTIAEIAAQLYLSEGTVRNYLSACIQKTGARNRAEALRIASERGWL